MLTLPRPHLPAMSLPRRTVDYFQHSPNALFGCDVRFFQPERLSAVVAHICLNPAGARKQRGKEVSVGFMLCVFRKEGRKYLRLTLGGWERRSIRVLRCGLLWSASELLLLLGRRLRLVRVACPCSMSVHAVRLKLSDKCRLLESKVSDSMIVYFRSMFRCTYRDESGGRAHAYPYWTFRLLQ